MSKVVNSVQQILAECDSMIAQTEGTEFIDVKGLADTLRDYCVKLKNVYENSPGEEYKIARYKAMTENAAIRLEFYMDVRLGLYTERRKLRNFAGTLYNDLRDICYAISKSNGKYSNKDTIEWGTRARWAIDLYARSMHIIFELDEKDEEMIKVIITEMQKFKEDEQNGQR